MFKNYPKVFALASLVFLSALSLQSWAQKSVLIGVGSVYTKFVFDDANAPNEKYKAVGTSSYMIGYRQNLGDGGLFFRLAGGSKNSETSLEYEGLDVNWRMQYMGLNANLGYMYGKGRLQPFLMVGPYWGYMVKGIQTIDGDVYDLNKGKLLNKSDFGLMVVPGLNFRLSDYISLFAEYNYLMGLSNIETAAGQKAFNRGYSIQAGLSINITALGGTAASSTRETKGNEYKRNPEVDDAMRHLRGIIDGK